MLINRRNAMFGGKRLPYDAEVEYLQANGTQWVDTGLVLPAPNTGYQVEIEYRYTSRPSNDTWLFGYWNNKPNARLYLVGYFEGYRCGAGPDTSSYWATIPYDANFHVAKLLNDGAYFDGVRLKPTALTSLANVSSSMHLSLLRSNHVDNGGTRQMKYARIWTVTGDMVRDLIAVRRTLDGVSVGEMYDRVTGMFMERHGTFVFGPDKARGASAANGGGGIS